MMGDFKTCLYFVLGVEGGHEPPDTLDPGGETKNGIDIETWMKYLERTKQAPRPLLDMKPFERDRIYLDEFWDPWQLGGLPQPWALFLFDAAVNLRWDENVMLSQSALYFSGQRIVVDGKLGPATRAIMIAHPELAKVAAVARIGYHVAKTEPGLLKGLLNRCVRLAAAVGA